MELTLHSLPGDYRHLRVVLGSVEPRKQRPWFSQGHDGYREWFQELSSAEVNFQARWMRIIKHSLC